MPVPYQATYAAAKAFVLSFSRALAYETMYTGVRVSVLAPGTTATGLHAKAGAENSRYVALLPAMTTEELARIAYRKFMRGKKVIVTGWFNRFSVIARALRARPLARSGDGMVLQGARRRRQSAMAPPLEHAEGLGACLPTRPPAMAQAYRPSHGQPHAAMAASWSAS